MRWLLSAVVAVALAGCAPTAPREADVRPQRVPEAPPMERLLSLLHEFLAADSAGRSRIYLEAVSELARAPSPELRLRLALLQGLPGHPHSRPDDALRLADLVMDDAALDHDTRELARVLRFWIASHGVEQRRRQELQARIDALQAEIAALQQQLNELTEIERVVEPDR